MLGTMLLHGSGIYFHISLKRLCIVAFVRLADLFILKTNKKELTGA